MSGVLGIDPGISGGLARLSPDGQLVEVLRVPKKKGKHDWAALEFILSWKAMLSSEVALERPQPFGKTRSSTQMMINYGRYLHILESLGFIQDITYHEVPIRSWKMHYGLVNTKKSQVIPLESFADSHKANKERSFKLANGLWPDAQERFGELWVSDTAEAALIADYWRMKRRVPK